MSLSGSLFNAVSGLQTTQRQIQVTSGNVSNANVEGYSRKTAPAVTALTAGQNSGVDLGQVRREVDAYLDGEVRRAGTELGGLEARTEFHARLTQLFGTLSNDSTLANGLSDLSAAMEALALEPSSPAMRNDVVEAADELARQLNRFSEETIDLRVEADREIAEGVATVNESLSRIEELNAEIAKAYALDRPAGELEDERDRQLTTLSEWMDISVFSRENGEIVVMGKTSEGSASTLVDSRAVSFQFAAANDLDAYTAGDAVNMAQNPDAELTPNSGGRLGALIELRDGTLTDFHRDIDQMAASVRERINAAHNQGTVGNAPTPGGSTMTGANYFGGPGLDASVSAIDGILEIAEVDASGTVVGSTTVDLGPLSVTNVNDLVTQMNGAVPGTPFQLTGGTEGQLEIAHTSGNDFVFSTGDATVTDGAGVERSFSHFFGLNNLFQTPGTDPGRLENDTAVANAARTIEVRADIKDQPSLLATGTPGTAAGDPAVAVGDNTVAQAMAAAFNQTGTIAAAGKLPAIGQATLADYAGDLLSFYATQTQRTETARDFQRTMHDELKFRADSESGVNIDEELSNMVTFEQAYNASARVISTVQQMFDTLDRMMN
jgi:flagellar hook-associated protein 1 FlgK